MVGKGRANGGQGGRGSRPFTLARFVACFFFFSVSTPLLLLLLLYLLCFCLLFALHVYNCVCVCLLARVCALSYYVNIFWREPLLLAT